MNIKFFNIKNAHKKQVVWFNELEKYNRTFFSKKVLLYFIPNSLSFKLFNPWYNFLLLINLNFLGHGTLKDDKQLLHWKI